MVKPNLSEESRRKGLERGRLVRKKRSEIKNSLKEGKSDMKSLFSDKKLFEKYISSMKVMSIISSLPGNGKVHAAELLKELKISPNKKMGGLGKNQKENFLKHFNIS